MSKCEICRLRKESAKAFDIHWLGEEDCPYDECPIPDFSKTNADRIRAMSDEELAEFMEPYDSGCPRWKEKPIQCSKRTNCRECWLDWLREEVTD